MSMPIVRRLTAAFVLAAVLCLASPATAAALRPPVPRVVLLDQVLAWLGELWSGFEPPTPAPAEKTAPPGPSSEERGTDPARNPETDGSGILDPNG